MLLDTPPSWGTYLDLTQDFKPWANLTNTTGRDAAMTVALEFACVWVQNYLNRPIAPTTITEYLDGDSGLNGIYLMVKYFPIIQVTSVTEYRGTDGGFSLPEQTPTNQLAQDSYQVDYLAGRLIRTGAGGIPRPWFPGSRNIVVSYWCGYEPIPADLKLATLDFAKYWWERTQNTRQSKQNDYGAETSPDLWPGSPNRITAILEPYRNIVMG